MMTNVLSTALHQVLGIKGKRSPMGGSGYAGSAFSFIDAFNKQPAPTALNLIHAYTQTAYACANLNAGAFASVPLRLYVQSSMGDAKPRVKTKAINLKQANRLRGLPTLATRLAKAVEIEEVLEHPLLDLLQQVNTWLDGYSLMELTDLFQEITGNAYWYIPRNKFGVPGEIWILPSQLVTTVRDPDKIVKHYLYASGKVGGVELDPDDVIAFRFPNLEDPYCDGWSPLQAAWQTNNLMSKSMAFEAAMFDNRAVPNTILTPKDAVSFEAAERMERKFGKRFRQAGSGGILILNEAFDVHTLAFSPRDLEMLKLHGVSKEDLANSFATPISLLKTEGVNRANAEAGHYQHARTCVLPRCRRFEQKLNASFAPLFDERLFVAFDNPVPEDVQQQITIQNADIQTCVRTINEVREERGFEPVEWGDKPWAPPGMTQLDEQPEPPPGGVDANGQLLPPLAEDRDDGDGSNKLDDVEETEKRVKTYVVVASYQCEDLSRELAYKTLLRLGHTSKTANELLYRAPLILDETEIACGACGRHHHMESAAPIMDKAGRRRPIIPSGNPLEIKVRAIVKQQRRQVMVLFKTVVKTPKKWLVPIDLTEWDEELALDAVPVLEAWYDKAGNETLVRVGVTPDPRIWNVQLPQVAGVINRSAYQFAHSTNETTSMELNAAIFQLRKELIEGIVEGPNTVRDLTQRVSRVFDKAEQFRAERIATTESSRAVHEAQQMAAVASDVVKGYSWLASSDACPLCERIAAENPTIPLGGKFATIGTGPYAEVRHPPAHPFCMCSMTEIIDKTKLAAYVKMNTEHDPHSGEFASGGGGGDVNIVPDESDTALAPSDDDGDEGGTTQTEETRAAAGEKWAEKIQADRALKKGLERWTESWTRIHAYEQEGVEGLRAAGQPEDGFEDAVKIYQGALDAMATAPNYEGIAYRGLVLKDQATVDAFRAQKAGDTVEAKFSQSASARRSFINWWIKPMTHPELASNKVAVPVVMKIHMKTGADLGHGFVHEEGTPPPRPSGDVFETFAFAKEVIMRKGTKYMINSIKQGKKNLLITMTEM